MGMAHQRRHHLAQPLIRRVRHRSSTARVTLDSFWMIMLSALVQSFAQFSVYFLYFVHTIA